jgi:uroporphyrinogen III methyltransferase/synthase
MVIRMGSRESALAVIQAETAAERIKAFDGGVTVEIITMKTQGDAILDKPLESIGGKGLFIRELDKALLDKKIDVAVHSLKDIPAFVEKGIAVKAFLKREDARDALVLPAGAPLNPLAGAGGPPAGADTSKPLGCSGGRRRAQLQKLFPDWEIKPIRGNVLTRLRKLDDGEYGGLVLAAASLTRLRLTERISRIFGVDEVIPAAGQGIIAVCAREAEYPAYLAAFLAAIDDGGSRAAATAERVFIRTLDGGCGAPIAAYAEISGDKMILRGLYAESEGSNFVTGSASGPVAECEELGKELAVRLLMEYHAGAGVKSGKVTLLGAGPGDAGLLTCKAHAALEESDVVLYDNLAGRGIIARIPAKAKTVYVGKKAGAHTLRQEAINSLLLKEAAAGKKVARLKGGDPFLFARGGEELELISRAGIPFEVIPGVSSALSVPAFAGIPATHRAFSSSVHIVSAHLKDDTPGIDYRALAQGGGTLIFLMGTSALESICKGLLDAGLAPDTPAAIVEQGTTAKQKKAVSTLARLHGDALRAGIAPPAITVVGEVCALSGEFSWFEKKALSGLRIGVTRPASRAAKLSSLLASEGAEVVEIPTIQTRAIRDTPELEAALSSLCGGSGSGIGGGSNSRVCQTPFSSLRQKPKPAFGTLARSALEPAVRWFAFTSPAGVEVFFDKLFEYGRDARALGMSRFAAIGKATAATLKARGISADLVPAAYSGAALGSLLVDTIIAEGGAAPLVILPRSRIAGTDITDALSAAGISFLDIPVYETAPPPHRDDPAFMEILTEGLDWLTFTSASTVRGFVETAGAERTSALQREGLRALCIGKATAETALSAGFDVVTAKNATLPDMVSALKEFVENGNS